MNTKLKSKLGRLAKGPTNLNDKIELEEKILSARFLSQIEEYLDSNKMSKKDFAKKLGVSASFISQLFTGDKIASLKFMAKIQLKLGIKFYISTVNQYDMEIKIDKAIDDMFKSIMDLERYKNAIEDEFLIFLAKNKTNYESINNQVQYPNHLKVA
jgi:transcriptional regulator with XRE-family HTH domain